MMSSRALLPWLCAALVACATGPKPRPSDDDGDGDGGAPENQSLLEILGDADKDGIDDARDRCPGEAEDKDQFRDEDGCPELDNDHDRILDADDKCPNEPETYNHRDDDDGCPDPGVVRAQPLYVIDPLLFARGRAVLDAAESALLDSLAVAIKDQVDCRVVELQGNAASRPNSSGCGRSARLSPTAARRQSRAPPGTGASS